MRSRKIIATVVLGLVCSVSLFARTGEDVYEEICAKCHIAYIAEDKVEQNFSEYNNTMLKLKAPPVSQIALAMKQKLRNPDLNEKINRLEVSAFIADYIIYPDRKKSILDPKVSKHFPTMPSLKGKISTEDIEIISNFAYDFDPKAYAKKSVANLPFEKVLQKAQREDKIILIEAVAPHCRYCKKMQEGTLVEPSIVAALKKDFITLIVDVSKDELPLDLSVHMTPSFFFIFPKQGSDKVKIKRIPGAWNKEDFLDILNESVLAKKNK